MARTRRSPARVPRRRRPRRGAAPPAARPAARPGGRARPIARCGRVHGCARRPAGLRRAAPPSRRARARAAGPAPHRPAPPRRQPAGGPRAPRAGRRRPRRAAGGGGARPRPAAPRRWRSHADAIPQRGELLRADARDLVELGHRAKAVVRLAVDDDLARRRGPDAVELIELLGRGRIEVERPAWRGPRDRGGGPPASPPLSWPAAGTMICWPSVTLAARLTPARSALAVGPPASRTASSTRRSACIRKTPGRRTAPATCTTAIPPPGASTLTACPVGRAGRARDRAAAEALAPPALGAPVEER